MIFEVLTIVFLVIAIVLGVFFWRSQSEKEKYRQTISSDLELLKNQIQALGGTAGDLGAIKAQVQTVSTSMQDLAVIKSQMEGLCSTASDIGGIKSQVESVSGAIHDLGAIKSQVEAIASTSTEVGGIKSQVESMSSALQDLGAIKSQVESLSATAETLGTIRTTLQNLDQRESEIRDNMQTITNKLVGSYEVGSAGENLLAEAFASFPPSWIERDFRVGGKVVEIRTRGACKNYSVVKQSDGSYLVTSQSSAEGPDTLKNVQILVFSDQQINLP